MYLIYEGEYNGDTLLKNTILSEYFSGSQDEQMRRAGKSLQSQPKPSIYNGFQLPGLDLSSFPAPNAFGNFRPAFLAGAFSGSLIPDIIKEILKPSPISSGSSGPTTSFNPLMSTLQDIHSSGAKSNSNSNSGDFFPWLSGLDYFTDVVSGKAKVRLPDDVNDILTGDSTIRSLLLGKAQNYKAANIPLRALGSSLHTVQDSFAHGHTERNSTNQTIRNFHCYAGQDHHQHEEYDTKGGDKLNPADLESFKDLHGGKEAIEACRKLINAFVDGKEKNRAFKDGSTSVWDVLDKIFELAPDAKPSNAEV